MSIDNINQASYTANLKGSPVTSSLASRQEMGQADFLLLLTTQLKNQDPSKPVDASSFVSDLTEMSQLEATNRMNISIQSMVQGFQAMQTMQATALMGKNVQVSGSEMSHIAGQNTNIRLASLHSLTDVKIVISDNNGAVRELNIGNLPAGEKAITWDGKNAANIAANSGQFSLIAFGTDAQGELQTINTLVPSRVNSVSIGTDGSTTLTLATGAQVAMSSVREISL